ncbi:UvrD-helicase domain-containing protein [Priestia megaterium]|uniref:UvrD-helicase domain-containing protein n=1 Tax=Priestia megaterium TaxID=1404 RepID=UPI001455B5C1|nr:ATP-dependent helicase [Priestia megaterium]
MIDNEVFRKNIACTPLTDSTVVQAGPGSGKTTLLVERLKYIIKHNTNPLSNVACITYTNAAKDEIMLRLHGGEQKLSTELFIGTIHSFLLDFVIKPYSHLIHKDNQTYKLAPMGFARGHKREIGLMMNCPLHSINEGIFRAFESIGFDEQGHPYCYANKIPPEVALEWKQLIWRKGYIDQQDVIYMSYLILKNKQHICNALSARFPYLLVDEYQDVTFYQEKIFSLFKNSSFFCVGDTNQSIYSFTGAKPEIFQEKWKNKEYKNYTLSNNFRSTAHIVKFSNYKTKITQIEAGLNASIDQKVLLIKNITEAYDVIQLFQRIRLNIECEEHHKPYMILARQNNYVNQLAHFLKKQEGNLNPFLKKLKKEHYRRFQILYNLLLAMSYKRRNEVNKAFEKMGEAFSYLVFNEHPNYVALSEIEYDAFMWKKLQIFTLNFLNSFEFSETSVESMFQELKDFISNTSKVMYGKSIGNKLRMLHYNWKNQVKASKSTMLSELIEQIELQVDFSENTESVMSIHSAKGQEAECVLIMAESESQLMEWFEDNLNSEEARVGYVAFSRARKLLCLWAPTIHENNFAHLHQHVMCIDDTYAIQTEDA